MNNNGIITQGISQTNASGGEKVLIFVLEEIYLLRESILKTKARKEKSTLPLLYFENPT